jgi:polar amino acid transport system substrate-binding protein
MQWQGKVFVAILLWFAGVSSHVLAATFEVGFYDYPPMMIEADKSGVYQDIFDELAKLMGDEFNISYYPYPRIGLLFNNGRLDIEPGVFPGWVQGQAMPGLFSVSFGKVVDVLVFNPGRRFSVKSPADLRGKSVGLVRGYAYPDLKELIESGQLERRNGLNEAQLLAMLAASRFDQVIINKAVAQYNILQVPKYRYFEVGDVMSSYDVSMRVSPKQAAWLPKLNAAILKLKETGVIDRIYAAYGVYL